MPKYQHFPLLRHFKPDIQCFSPPRGVMSIEALMRVFYTGKNIVQFTLVSSLQFLSIDLPPSAPPNKNQMHHLIHIMAFIQEKYWILGVLGLGELIVVI